MPRRRRVAPYAYGLFCEQERSSPSPRARFDWQHYEAAASVVSLSKPACILRSAVGGYIGRIFRIRWVSHPSYVGGRAKRFSVHLVTGMYRYIK